MIVTISVFLGVLCYVLATALFAAEAWSSSPRQSFFIVLVPGYVVYYALIDSSRELPFRLLLMASIVLSVLLPVLLETLKRTATQ